MRTIFYSLTVALLLSLAHSACDSRPCKLSVVPVTENELLPATNSLHVLPDW